jgi:hypothetical protein
LTEALSHMLHALATERCLLKVWNSWYRRPELESSLKENERLIDEQLAGLPEDFNEDAPGKLLVLGQKFISELSKYLNGTQGYKHFLQQLRPKFETLQQRIEETDPSRVTEGETNGTSPNLRDGPSIPLNIL